MSVKELLDRSYDTVRYGTVVNYEGEVVRDGYLYHALPVEGNAQAISRRAGVARIRLVDIPPAPFAPEGMPDEVARIFHYLEWGRREFLAATTPEVVAKETAHTQAWAAELGAGIKRPSCIWWRFLTEEVETEVV